MGDIARKYSINGQMTAQEIWDRLQPFLTPGMTIEDVSGLVVVATYTNGAVDVGGPHRAMHKGLILAQALEFLQKALTSEDVMDFLVDGVDMPDDPSGIDGL